jgi:hypothetical protein
MQALPNIGDGQIISILVSLTKQILVREIVHLIKDNGIIKWDCCYILECVWILHDFIMTTI